MSYFQSFNVRVLHFGVDSTTRKGKRQDLTPLDSRQNIDITVFVLKNGYVEETAVDLDLMKAAEIGRDVVLRRTKTHCVEANN